jgi:hypothetical protein
MLTYAHKRVIALLACLAVLLAWQGRLSWEHAHRYESHNDRSHKANNKGVQVSSADETDDRLARYTFLVAIFTAVLSGSTLLLWWQTRKSAKIAERALTELERPYLFILDYNWLLAEKAKADDLKCGLVYSVMNGGKLPAFIRSVKVGRGFGETIPPMQDEPPIHDLLTAPLIAGGEQRQV